MSVEDRRTMLPRFRKLAIKNKFAGRALVYNSSQNQFTVSHQQKTISKDKDGTLSI